MDSMDWFDPKSEEAPTQISALNRALKLGGRVMLRSAGLKPWYIPVFESNGFTARRVGARLPGSCIDRYDFNAHVPSFTLANDYPGLTCMPVRGS
jgi:betaine lipid synthase